MVGIGRLRVATGFVYNENALRKLVPNKPRAIVAGGNLMMGGGGGGGGGGRGGGSEASEIQKLRLQLQRLTEATGMSGLVSNKGSSMGA